MVLREGSLEAPTRYPLDWRSPDFHNEAALFQEMERVFDICHGCRRCVSLCLSFPTLFGLIDESPTLELDGVAKADYWQVVNNCYLCDLCYMTKCPYVPPHEWNLDFPHLMLRAKVFKFKRGEGNMRRKLRDRVLTSTDLIGSLAGIPLVAQAMNVATQSKPLRKALQVVAEIDVDAWLPTFHATPLRSRLTQKTWRVEGEPAGRTRGKMALFATCYINRNEPGIGEDFAAVYEHNGIPITVVEKERCCGMPKLELGDLESVVANKEINIPQLAKWVDEGWDLTALVPSCVLMFKQELPLLFPDDADVQKVKNAFYDPFEYLMLRHKEGKLKTDFKQGLGKVAYHVACHQRVQNIGLKTRDVLALVPDTVIEVIERCSGHDGTYAVKHESHAFAMKIVKPVVTRVQQAKADHYGSDCPMAAHHIEHALHDGHAPQHPMTLLRKAYAI